MYWSFHPEPFRTYFIQGLNFGDPLLIMTLSWTQCCKFQWANLTIICHEVRENKIYYLLILNFFENQGKSSVFVRVSIREPSINKMYESLEAQFPATLPMNTALPGFLKNLLALCYVKQFYWLIGL